LAARKTRLRGRKQVDDFPRGKSWKRLIGEKKRGVWSR